MTETPARYQRQPEDREPWERKDWLYAQYWGELRSPREIADDVSCAKSTIQSALEEHGIPRRPARFNTENSVSAFSGFYGADKVAWTDAESVRQYEPNAERNPMPSYIRDSGASAATQQQASNINPTTCAAMRSLDRGDTYDRGELGFMFECKVETVARHCRGECQHEVDDE